MYQQSGWAVDGDVARAVLPQHWYNVGMQMMRRDGVWRICWIAGNDQDQKNEIDRAQRAQQVLNNLDKYSTPGAVLRALNNTYAQQPDRAQSLKTMRQQLAEAERQAATQPAQSADEQFHRDLGMLYGHVAIAFLSENPQEAAKYYYAEGDDGSYTLARERRALAARDLEEAAGAEVGAGAGVTLTTLADDLYGLMMVQWSFTDDAAISKGGPDGAPMLRKINGMWRIDVSPETNGDPKQAAKEAQHDAEQIAKLTARVKNGEFKTADSFHQAVRAARIKGFAKSQ